MTVEVRLLGVGDEAMLASVAPDVFDHPLQAQLTAEFLADKRHHLAVAREAGRIVGFASAVHYVHPDKPPELWVNEVGVAPTHEKQGIGRQLLQALFARGRELGCAEAWLGTAEANIAARRLYSAAGGMEAPMVYITFQLTAR